MQGRGSTYRRTSLFLALLAFPLLAAGCGPREVWGIPADDLKDRLSSARYAVLARVDFSANDPAQALILSPGAPYYLSFIFDSLDMPDQSTRMLELAWEKSPDPWKREAGVLLGQRYVARHDYPRAIQVARAILASQPPSDLEQKARRVLVEALYWTQSDAEALKEADGLLNPDAEVLLFRGVSSLRLALPDAHDLIMRLFLQHRASTLHERVFTYLGGEPSYRQLFTDLEWDLISAKDELSVQDWESGIPLLENVLQRIDPALVTSGTLVADLSAAFQSSGNPAAGARFLERISARFSGRARADALEQAGRLYRRARNYPQAMPVLRAAAAASAFADQRDRARWLVLDMLVMLHPADLLAQIEKESASWGNPAYFSDVLEGWISDLVAAKKWDTMAGLWKLVRVSGPDDVDARLSYILARANTEGLVRRLPGSPPMTAAELFAEAAAKDADGYYGLMASCALGRAPAQTVMREQSADAAPPAPLDPLITGFLPFGLTSPAYQRLVEARGSLSDAQVLEAAHLLSRVDDYASSMHLMNLLARRRPLSEEELQVAYPRAFSPVIDGLAGETGVQESVLYGMVREESYFDPDIISSAGAVGLTQLMPSTATAVARTLNLSEPDLRDPVTNLTMGARHLQDLLAKVQSVPKALLSYNAGLARVRAWERTAGGMPADLFVEAVPFDESRSYVRKILVSTVMYSFLYEKRDPRETVREFFGLASR